MPLTALILDDDPARDAALRDRFPNHRVVIERGSQDAIFELGSLYLDAVSLDFDLGDGRSDSGLDVAKYIVAMPAEFRPAHVWIHTQSRDGMMAMKRVLHEAGIRPAWAPYRDDTGTCGHDDGAYYSREHDNWYCRTCKRGMGTAYYQTHMSQR